MNDASCKGMDANLFFPHKGNQASVATAKQVCAGCPVADECRGYALRYKLRHGIWGGTTEKDRRPGVAGRRTVATPDRVAAVMALTGQGQSRIEVAAAT